MEIPKYIVFRVDVMRKGTSVELTNITDEVEDVIFKADRKTENCSEIPNNCKYAENPSGDVWECGCFLDTYCEHQIYDRNPDGTINIVKCGYEPKDEPQIKGSKRLLKGKDEQTEREGE